MIKIELSGSTTIVSELAGNDGSEVLQKHFVNKPLDYHLEGEGEAIIFVNHEQLTKMGIRHDNLTTITSTALGNPSNQTELLSAFASSSYFVNFNTALGSSKAVGLGWAQYNDGQYIEASPLSVTVAAGATVVDIDGASSIKTYLPEGIADLYDVASSKITPENVGDGYTFTFQFKGKSTSNNGAASFAVNIGGSIGQIFKRDFRFPRGTGVEHDFYFTSQGYSLNTFVTNGGVLELTSKTGTNTFYDISLQIHRTYKADS